MARDAVDSGVRWKFRALWLVLLVVGMTIGGAVVGLLVHGPLGALVGVIPGAVASVIAGFVPGVLDNARTRKEQALSARTAWEMIGGLQLSANLEHSRTELLRPERGVVDFTGRSAELAQLREWCSSSDVAPSVRVLVGAGGVGKTRLALQVARDWAAQEHHECRLVASGQEAQAVQAARGVTQDQVLLVVDYAETRGTGLRELLAAVLAPGAGPIRVLLLARSLGEWWDDLTKGQEHAIASLLRQAAPIQLGPLLADGKSDLDLAEEAMPCFAHALEVDPPGPASMVFELPAGPVPILVLHAAALVAVLRSMTPRPGRTPVIVTSEVLDELLEHEERYWRRTATSAGLTSKGPVLRPVVAAAALLGASSLDEAAELVGRVPDQAGTPLKDRRCWARWLFELYPAGSDGYLGLLQPDLLAETHVVRELSRDPALARSCLMNLAGRQAERAMTVLAQAWGHHPVARDLTITALRDDLGHLALPAARASIQTRAALGDVLADAASSAPATLETLIGIAEALPHPSVVLARANAAITERILRELPAQSGPQVRGRWADRAGTMLSAAGRPDDALPAHQEAVGIYRQLVAADPGRYRPALARALDHLGVCLWTLGRPEEALPVAQEAVGENEQLVAADPASYRPALAQALDNLGVLFSELGHPADALPVTMNAVALLRDLGADTASPHRPALARALDNLGVRYSELGMPGKARPVTQEAVDILSELAAASPDSYRPDLAQALDRLGVRFSELGMPEEALSPTQQSVELRRALAKGSPERYQSELSDSLANLSVRYSELDQPEEALSAAEDVVALRRALASGNPDRHCSDLASSLDSLGLRLWDLGRAKDALEPAEEAVSIYRQLATASPDRHQGGLARSLSHLGVWLWALRLTMDALPVIQEAAGIRRDLARSNPGLYRPELAESLSNLGIVFRDLGDLDKAVPYMREAVTAYRELAAAGQDRYCSNLAIAEANLADALSDAGGSQA